VVLWDSPWRRSSQSEHPTARTQSLQPQSKARSPYV
jgi:hypothetical protein